MVKKFDNNKSYLNKYTKDFKNLCTPASIYFFFSIIIFLALALQNFGNNDVFCMGPYKCNVGHTFVIFIFHILYILFWTFILNVLCKAGYSELSWIFVLLPILLFFVIMGLILLTYNEKTSGLLII
tara:strand:+ start:156 stop:533 length:378 start_codon:yes stop_codon:yes gene_type:complete